MKIIIRGKTFTSSTASAVEEVEPRSEKPAAQIQTLIDRAHKITSDYKTQLSRISDPKLRATVTTK